MTYCRNCGAQIEDNIKTCPACGTSVEKPTASQKNFSETVSKLNETPDTTAEFDTNDINQSKGMAILAYLGILVLIPLFAAPQSKFARYHTNQGLILAIIEIIYGFAFMILSFLLYSIFPWRMWGFVTFILGLIGLCGLVFVALMIIGIINAANGKAKELPVIGKHRILK